MAINKTYSTIIATGTSVAAGGTQTGASIDLTTKDGAIITGLLTNGATGPSVRPLATVEVSFDNTNWKQFYVVSGDTSSSTTTHFSCRIPRPVLYARVVVSGNTGQAITCEAFAQIVAS